MILLLKRLLGHPDQLDLPRKPQLEVNTVNVQISLHVSDYIPDLSTVKSEPVDPTGSKDYTVIGHLISQPKHISKELKQELIDSAAQTVVGRHSSQCELSRFVHERQSDTGLHIEDVRSLMTVDDQSRSQPTVPVCTADPLPVVTAPVSTAQPPTRPLPVVTPIMQMEQPIAPIESVQSTPQSLPLPVVTIPGVSRDTTDASTSDLTMGISTAPVTHTPVTSAAANRPSPENKPAAAIPASSTDVTDEPCTVIQATKPQMAADSQPLLVATSDDRLRASSPEAQQNLRNLLRAGDEARKRGNSPLL